MSDLDGSGMLDTYSNNIIRIYGINALQVLGMMIYVCHNYGESHHDYKLREDYMYLCES